MNQEAESFKRLLVKNLGENYQDITRKNLILTWRQQNSYEMASKIYPFADNRLMPDIAFSAGPLHRLKTTVVIKHQVDILFLLRKDIESVISKSLHGISSTDFIAKVLKKHGYSNVTYTVVDWGNNRDFMSQNNVPKSRILPSEKIQNTVYPP